MKDFFEPKSIAVIGASRDETKGGNVVLRNLICAGFKGKIFPINPKSGEILGLKCYENVLKVKEAINLGIIVVPRDRVCEALNDCGKKGIKSIIIVAGGISKFDEEGKKVWEEIKAIKETYGIRIMGPNSIGVINTSVNLCTSIVDFSETTFKKGNVAFFGQTGLFMSGPIKWAMETENIGISKVASIGNNIDIDEVDVLNYLSEDINTDVICMYVEGIKDGKKFYEVIKKVTSTKKVIVLKAGRTDLGARAVASHTGSMASDDRIFDSICRQTSMVRVFDYEALYRFGKGLSICPIPMGKKVGVISITGLGCSMSSDLVDEHNLILSQLKESTIEKLYTIFPQWDSPKNPVDLWSAIEKSGGEKAYTSSIQFLLEDENVDILLVILVAIKESKFPIRETIQKMRKKFLHKPIIFAFMKGQREMVFDMKCEAETGGAPVFFSINEAFEFIEALCKFERHSN